MLSGHIADANLRYLALGIEEMGIRLAEARIIPDDGDMIARTVNEYRLSCYLRSTTVDIGPTHDDITAASIARAFGVPLERNADAPASPSRALLPRKREKRSYGPWNYDRGH